MLPVFRSYQSTEYSDDKPSANRVFPWLLPERNRRLVLPSLIIDYNIITEISFIVVGDGNEENKMNVISFILYIYILTYISKKK